jgi:hypothetical protein
MPPSMTLCAWIRSGVTHDMCCGSTVAVKTGAQTAQVLMVLQSKQSKSSSRLRATYRGRGPEDSEPRKEVRDDGR